MSPPLLAVFRSLSFFICIFSHSTIESFHSTATPPRSSSSSALSNTLKPAAEPLMAAGKALARTGEQLIDWTAEHTLYGGALSAAGASVRNAGDAVAQAAASCRFKTGRELVMDELREAGTCLEEAAGKLKQAVEEAGVDEDEDLAKRLDLTIQPVTDCSVALEGAGAAVLRGSSVKEIGRLLVVAGESLKPVCWAETISCQSFSQQAIIAGNRLQGIQSKPASTNWLKPNAVE